MKFEPKEDIKRIIIVCIAAVIMALNIKSFVRTGGLYPGGATGLALLIQRAGDLFFPCDGALHRGQRGAQRGAGVYRVPVYREEIHPVLLPDDRAHQCADRYAARLCDHL